MASESTALAKAQTQLDELTTLFDTFKTAPHDTHVGKLGDLAEEFLVAARDAWTAAQTRAETPAPAPKRKFANYVQQYDPDTLELLTVYEGPRDAVNCMGEGAPQNVTDAARTRKVYLGFRWAEVPKSGDPAVPLDIGETLATKACHGGHVARLSEDLQTVMDVYASQAEAAEHTNRTQSAVCAMINKPKGREASRWLRWSKVDEAMRAEYLARRALPPLPSRNGRAVLQLDCATREPIARHDTAAKVMRLFGMGAQSLKDACDGANPAPLKGFCWAWADV